MGYIWMVIRFAPGPDLVCTEQLVSGMSRQGGPLASCPVLEPA